jgi:hypothetical protein
MLTFRHQNVRERRNIKKTSSCFENIADFKYLRKTLTKHEEIKTILIWKWLFPLSSEWFFFPSLSTKTNIEIHKSKSLRVVLYGYRSWYLKIKEIY